jgi:protein O-mannosyl-transferase
MSKKPRPPRRPESSLSPSPDTIPRAVLGWRAHLGVLCTLAVVAALLYFPSLHAPWYLDDMTAIVQNPETRDLGGSLGKIFLPRGLALFSFALNYHLGGTDPFGYHLVNLGLHIGCGLLVYLLLRRVRESVFLPVLGALLFIAHPLQTQAVTYVVQRMAVLAALFFLLSLWLFVRARERLAGGVPFADAGHLRYYLGALIAGLGAIFTKENTAVLPVVLYLYVIVLLPPATDRRRLLLSLLPFVAGPLALTAVRLLVPIAGGETLANIANPTLLATAPHFTYFTPLHYLVTEFSVLWIYIRMLLLPYGQAFEHNISIATSLFELHHLAAGAALLLLGALAVWLRRRQPLIATGIAWFFLTLAVESSFIPLDPLYEHRLYLPMFGFILVVLGLLQLLPGRRFGLAALVVMVLLYLPLTWERNRLWADPIAFYSDNLAKFPGNVRVLTDLALKVLNDGPVTAAEPLLRQALESNPDYTPAWISLVAVYNRQGRMAEAFAAARQGLERSPHSPALLRALATTYSNSGDLEQALPPLEQILAADPRHLLARTDRAFVLARLGRLPEAEAEFRKVLAIDANDIAARNGLALVLKSQGKRY